VTHTNALLNCEAEFDEFIGRMTLLKEKLGPLLFQFPHFNRSELKGPGPLFSRLRVFLKRAAEAYKCRFAVQIRNRKLLDTRLTDLLGEHSVALTLTDTSLMPRPSEYREVRSHHRRFHLRSMELRLRGSCHRLDGVNQILQRGRPSLEP
jgi:uncharacterized protein YecE (DUF72 family)